MSWYSEIKIWAQSLEERWKQARSEGQDFALFATEAMREHKFHENFILEKEIRNIMESSVYPYQVRPMSAFGEPPITLHFSQDESFYLDL